MVVTTSENAADSSQWAEARGSAHLPQPMFRVPWWDSGREVLLQAHVFALRKGNARSGVWKGPAQDPPGGSCKRQPRIGFPAPTPCLLPRSPPRPTRFLGGRATKASPPSYTPKSPQTEQTPGCCCSGWWGIYRGNEEGSSQSPDPCPRLGALPEHRSPESPGAKLFLGSRLKGAASGSCRPSKFFICLVNILSPRVSSPSRKNFLLGRYLSESPGSGRSWD